MTGTATTTATRLNLGRALARARAAIDCDCDRHTAAIIATLHRRSTADQIAAIRDMDDDARDALADVWNLTGPGRIALAHGASLELARGCRMTRLGPWEGEGVDVTDEGDIAAWVAEEPNAQCALLALALAYELTIRDDDGVVPRDARWTGRDGYNLWKCDADQGADEDELAADTDPDDWRSDDDEGTDWIDITWYLPVVRWDGSVGEVTYDRTFAIEPPDPDEDCDHDWQSPLEVVGGCDSNPGVRGNGGGVIITEVCAHCARYRRVNTWAQNMRTGEQGLTSVEYGEPDEASEAWVASLSDDDDADADE